MDLWDREAIDLVGPAFIEFTGEGGQFRFIAVDGWMDCRHGLRNGRPFVDFTWDANDECDPASGQGWVSLQKDGSLTGHIYPTTRACGSRSRTSERGGPGTRTGIKGEVSEGSR